MDSTFAQEENWKIKDAKLPNGSKYTGTVNMTKYCSLFNVTWQTSAGSYKGLGINKGTDLYCGYGIGSAFGLVVYDIKADGTLVGIWAASHTNDMTGTEKVLGASALNGTYLLTGINPGNHQPYQGTIKIKKNGSTYIFTWTIGDTSHSGTGISDGKRLAVSWSGSAAYGIVMYKIAAKTATGIWASGGSDALGSENLTKK